MYRPAHSSPASLGLNNRLKQLSDPKEEPRQNDGMSSYSTSDGMAGGTGGGSMWAVQTIAYVMLMHCVVSSLVPGH